MKVVAHHTIEELQQLVHREKNADLRDRLRMVLQARQKQTAREIADSLQISEPTVRRWVARYNRHSLEGLQRKSGQGRKPKLSPEQLVQLEQRIDQGALPEDHVSVLRGKDFQRILQEEYGKLYQLSSVYALLHRLGFTPLRPRPQHLKNEEEVMEAFKKNA